MATVSQNIRVTITSQADEIINQSFTKRAAEIFAEEAIAEIRDRNRRGIDRYGNRFPAYTKAYKNRKGSAKGRSQMTKGRRKTEFAAKGVPNWSRLTGQLFSDMTYRVGRSINSDGLQGFFSVTLDVKRRSVPKVLGLESVVGKKRNGRSYVKRARYVWGLAEEGKRKDLETDRIMTRVFKRLGFRNLNGSYTVPTNPRV